MLAAWSYPHRFFGLPPAETPPNPTQRRVAAAMLAARSTMEVRRFSRKEPVMVEVVGAVGRAVWESAVTGTVEPGEMAADGRGGGQVAQGSKKAAQARRAPILCRTVAVLPAAAAAA